MFEVIDTLKKLLPRRRAMISVGFTFLTYPSPSKMLVKIPAIVLERTRPSLSSFSVMSSPMLICGVLVMVFITEKSML